MSARPTGSDDGPVRPEDLDVTLAVRRELGPDHDDAVVGEFLDRVGAAIDARVDARVAERSPAVPPAAEEKPSVALGVVSLLSGIPISGIVLGTTHGSVAGVILMIITWMAIAAVNVAHTRRR
jgi:hypothetical protein